MTSDYAGRADAIEKRLQRWLDAEIARFRREALVADTMVGLAPGATLVTTPIRELTPSQ
ncbi:MAG: hypothetical protein JWM05_1337 [Acidimicrobiales bacterium]|nr:hypothetical protein [Acidimicrobiales bacterium]